ncbi:MAG: MFS transporter [Acidimicrobiales bacterium]
MAADDLPTRELYEDPVIYQRRWFLLGVLCLSLVIVVMSVSGLNVALPEIQRSLDASATDLQWIVDSYAIVFAGLLLTAGAIGDRFGRRRALLGGLAVFGLGSGLGAFTDTASGVIAARVVMGIGAAFVMPATLSLLIAVFPPQERGRAIAIWAGFAGAGGAIGPLVVGFLLTGWWVFPAYWWGSAFLVNVVTAVLVIIAVLRFAPRSRDDAEHPLDPVGAGLSLVGLAALLYVIIEGPNKGWLGGHVVGFFVIAAIALGGFVLWEKRRANPMLPMEFFANRTFSIGSGVVTFGFLVMFGFFFLVTQYYQLVRGYSPLRAGAANLPMAATMVMVAPRSALIGERIGVFKMMAAGFSAMTAGLLVLATLEPHSSYLHIVGGLVLLGAGMGTTAPPATGAIMSAVPMHKAGVGSAVNDTTREVGGALGIAVLGSIATSVYRSSISVGGLPEAAAAHASESVGGSDDWSGVGRRGRRCARHECW